MNWYKIIKAEEKLPYKIKTKKIKFGPHEDEYEYAESLNGYFLGEPREAAMLFRRHAFDPNSFDSIGDSNVACVAFDTELQEWFGWSHRAIASFGIGDTSKTSSPFGEKEKNKTAKTLEEAKEFAKLFAESVS